MSLVGWREIAEVTARVVENVRIQPYTRRPVPSAQMG